MTLVNDTDANRDNIDEYMKELEHLSDQQLVLLGTLGEVSESRSDSKKMISVAVIPHTFLSLHVSPWKATTGPEVPVLIIQSNMTPRSMLIF